MSFWKMPGKGDQDGCQTVGKYELGRTIGRGTFAKVKLGRNAETGEKVAIKVILKEKVLQTGRTEQTKREISAMKMVKHPNVVQLYEVLASKSVIYLVMEYVSGGELFQRLANAKRLEEAEARTYFQQLIYALDFCHSRGVSHRDIKPENLLLDGHGNLKIADFGLSALPEQARNDGLLHTTCGTPNYVAPEVLLNKGYDGAKTDLWSCGIILFVLLAGYLPFKAPNLRVLYKNIGAGKFECPSWFSLQLTNLVHRLLEPDPQKRITMREVEDYPWFKDGISQQLEEYKTRIGDFEADLEDAGAAFEDGVLLEKQQLRPGMLNAFELISLCPGLNLSGLFESAGEPKHHDLRFISKCSASEIICKLEDIAKTLDLKMKRRECKIKLQGTLLAIIVEVFEVAPSLLMVELSHVGDELEYERFYMQKFRTTLCGIESV
uniref:non-specific serine/threonine protein kinase n=1 Tax=Araucaria cunninghamii TaxID=56994 RepID=A0A0D6QVP8_ARACU